MAVKQNAIIVCGLLIIATVFLIGKISKDQYEIPQPSSPQKTRLRSSRWQLRLTPLSRCQQKQLHTQAKM